jgi:SAM-dependent methyltransferase
MITESTKPTPPEIYERALVPAVFEPLSRTVVPLAAPAEGERVLDLACGTGVIARAVAPLVGSSGSVVGVELRPPMLAVARSLPAPDGAEIEWREGDATALDLPDGSFDLVVCQQGLQFFDDPAPAIAEAHRVLRPGGRFVAAVWQGIDHQPFWKAQAEIELPHLDGMTFEDLTVPFSWPGEERLRSLLDEAGFGSIETSAATIEASFAAETFTHDIDYPYSVIVPAFAQEPGAFADFVARVQEDSREFLERYRRGGRIVFEIPTHLATARRPA